MKKLCCVLAMLVLAGCAHDRVHRQSGAAGGTGCAAGGDNIQLPQSERYACDQDGPPADAAAAHARVSKLVEPEPRVEPRSRYGNGPTYTVRGHTYTVLSTASGYHAKGIASWYGRKFQGHLTSSMERYDMHKFTAAHKTLPLPSYARVTNLANGKSIIVRVNDRGPFHANRLIDLSWAAAVRLGIWKTGTGLVEVDGIDPRHPAELPTADVVTRQAHEPLLYLQVGAYAEVDNARHMLRRLRGMGITQGKLRQVRVGGRRLSRVRIGPMQDVAAVDRLSRTLEKQGIQSVRVEIQSSSEE